MKTQNSRAMAVSPSLPKRTATRTSGRTAAKSRAPSLLVFPGGTAPLRTLQNASGLLSRAWRWFRARQVARSTSKRLQVATSVSLGEKRFVAVIQVDGLQFLVGGGATNVVLLAQLNGEESFSKVFNETMSAPKKQPAKRVKKRAAKPAVARMGEQA